MCKRILIWFRNDLRFHDNEMLNEAASKADELLPVFIFDPRQFTKDELGIQKTGYNRAKFLLESVADLKSKFNGKLLIAKGLPKDILPELVQKYKISEVYHHREVANEETTISTNVENALWKVKINLKYFITHTLYNKEDLPFPIKDIPDNFLKFKKRTKREAIVKPCFDIPTNLKFVQLDDWGTLPELNELCNDFTNKHEGNAIFNGGESTALNYLNQLLNNNNPTKSNQKYELNSALSTWISLGCLSPRKIYWEIKKYEEQNGENSFTQQLFLGLIWRDYFRFMLKKHERINTSEQVCLTINLQEIENFNSWRNAQTDNELVNIIMVKLKNTGHINHLEKQLVANYLIYNLHVNWKIGEKYFEETLVDFCFASNHGNWLSIAGLDYDSKNIKHLNIEKITKILSQNLENIEVA